MYLPVAWPLIGPWHKTAAVVFIVCPYLFLYLAAASDPGYVGADNVRDYMNLYPYDYTIFHPGQECRTCRIPKPARSKHCSLCGRCVARADHHCIFINSCVGYRNHRWFILLLLSTAMLITYGTLLGLSLLSATVRARLPGWNPWPLPPPELGWHRYVSLWAWALQRSTGMGAVTLLTLLLSPVIWAFFLYTVYMLHCGMTTNESLKWSEWRDEVRFGTAYRRSMSLSRVKDPRFEGPDSRWPVDTAQIIVTTATGMPPTNPNIPGHGPWGHLRVFANVDNLYDLGLWNNTLDVFLPNYRFRKGGLPENVGMARRRTVAWRPC